MFDDYSNCAMNPIEFKRVRDKCKELLSSDWRIQDLIACIHDLFQEYSISEEQETELYNLVDPDEMYNEPYEYWCEMSFDNPLLNI